MPVRPGAGDPRSGPSAREHESRRCFPSPSHVHDSGGRWQWAFRLKPGPAEPTGFSRSFLGLALRTLGPWGGSGVGPRPQRHARPAGSSDPRNAAAAAARLATPSFARMFDTWFLTVFV